MRLYNTTHKQEHIEGNRRWRKRHPEWHQEYSWKKQGIVLTSLEREMLLDKQKGRCAICQRPETGFKKKLHVDHNHQTGKVRGLLCATCNWRVVSLIEKYSNLIPIAKIYLARHKN